MNCEMTRRRSALVVTALVFVAAGAVRSVATPQALSKETRGESRIRRDRNGLQQAKPDDSPATVKPPSADAARPADALVEGWNGRTVSMHLDYLRFFIPQPLVHVSLDGGKPQPFIFDTGWDDMLIYGHVADEMKLSREAPRRVAALSLSRTRVRRVAFSSGREGSPTYTANHVEGDGFRPDIGDFPVSNAPWFAVDGIAGVVGPYYFGADAVFALDFERHRLVLSPDKHPRLRRPGAVVVPLTFADPDSPLCTVDAEVVGRGGKAVRLRMLVDTGVASTVLPASLLGGVEPVDRADFTETGFSAAGMNEGRPSLFAEVRLLGKATLPAAGAIHAEKNVPAVVQHSPPAGQALLGMDFLTRFGRVTVDRQHRELILERPRPDRATRLPGDILFTLRRDGDKLVVDHIQPDIPAALREVLLGDELYLVDNVQPQPWAWVCFRTAAAGDAGTPADLWFKRKGSKEGEGYYQVQYTRPPLFPDTTVRASATRTKYTR